MQTISLLWVSELTVMTFGFSQVMISCFCVLSITVHVWVSVSVLRVQPVFSPKWLCRKCFWRTSLVLSLYCITVCLLSVMTTKEVHFNSPPGGEQVQCLYPCLESKKDHMSSWPDISSIPCQDHWTFKEYECSNVLFLLNGVELNSIL